MGITAKHFGKLHDGRTVELFTLTNAGGMEVGIMNYGGAITVIKAPDRAGALADVTLGFDTLEGYLQPTNPYFGALCGRVANRIANGRFKLGPVEYKLAQNNGKNSLHGGLIGFDKKLWAARILESPQGPALELSYTSPDGEEGYPASLHTQVLYSLSDHNELKIDYFATSDRETLVNLTNHAYFNLAGEGNGNVLGHEMQLHADCFTPIDNNLIPTGHLAPVKGTPFDFTRGQPIGLQINEDHPQLTFGLGYDHNFVINRTGHGLAVAAKVREPKSGRTMEVYTTEPGVQLYTGNFLNQDVVGKGGKTYDFRFGFCLETQHFPDAINHPHFPSIVLHPGQTYRQTTVYKFGAE
jgi:aldose 1-epimerase